MGQPFEVIGLGRGERAVFFVQRHLVKAATSIGLRDDTSLTTGDRSIRVDRETQKLLGVKDMRIFTAVDDLTYFPGQKAFLDGVLSTSSETGAKKVDRLEEANVIFLPGTDKETMPGMYDYRDELHRGVSGVAFGPIRLRTDPDLTTTDVWRTMGHSFTKFTIHPEVDNVEHDGKYIAFWNGTMEGAYHRTDIRNGYLEAAERLNFTVATEFVTNNEVTKTLPPRGDIVRASALEVITTCAKLGEWGFMPPLDLKDYVPEGGEVIVRRLINQAGLSTGNASVWDPELEAMQMTASGVKKDELKPSQVLLVKGFNEEFDGVVVLGYEIEKDPPKLSVEGFDNLLNYIAILGVETGNIKTGDINEIIGFAKDTERVTNAMKTHKLQGRQIHFHAHPIAWRPDITVVKPNPSLALYGNANAGCGTRAQAYYVAEMIARGRLERPQGIIIARMQKHGSQIYSPYDYKTTMRIINPKSLAPQVVFGPVDMEAREQKTA